MAIDHRMVHFRSDELGEIVEAIDEIAGRSNGREWVTISPWVDPENLPIVSVLHRIFSARGSKIPEITWVPGIDREPAQLGLLHATGPNAVGRLVDAAVPTPDGWITVNDHTKRGLLFAIHPQTVTEITVKFAIGAAAALASVPTDDRWVAQVSTSLSGL